MLNTVALMGRLTAEPILKATPSGVVVLPFQLAVSKPQKNADGTRAAAFIDCVAWRENAEFIAAHFRKGNLVAVVGELDTRSYISKSGDTHKVTEIVVRKVEFTGEKAEPQM